jgi:beta-N-acetylhexosaminidase
LSLSALVPFRNAIREGLDAMFVGGCAMANASTLPLLLLSASSH